MNSKKKSSRRGYHNWFRLHIIPLTYVLLLIIYIFAELRVIGWGIPSPTIAYPYQMEEWHFFMGITSLFKHFSNNLPGAQLGTSFFLILSGIYLAPFVLLHIIHPSVIRQHLTPAGLMQLYYVFIILRSITLIFGILTLILIYQISKKYLRINPLIPVVLLGAAPLWISWSNIFKSDIAVIFWIVLSVYLLLEYINKPGRNVFLLAGFVCGLGLATKISALPLIALYLIAFFLFTPKAFKQIKTLVIGVVIFAGTFALLGIPDVIFLHANWADYIAVDVGEKPNGIFGMPWYLFLLFEHYPIIFGQGLYLLTLIAGFYYAIKIYRVDKKKLLNKHKNLFFLALGLFLFSISLSSLAFGAKGERMLVVLPFIASLSGYAISRLINRNRYVFILFLCIVIAVQLFESYAFLSVKLGDDPRALSSQWIIKHIKPQSTIILENIPIYQGIPDILMTDFYQSQNQGHPGIYKYQVDIDRIEGLPDYAVITNAPETQQFVLHSSKKLLFASLAKKGYREVALFTMDHRLYSYFGDERNFYYSQITPFTSIEIYARENSNWTKDKH